MNDRASGGAAHLLALLALLAVRPVAAAETGQPAGAPVDAAPAAESSDMSGLLEPPNVPSEPALRQAIGAWSAHVDAAEADLKAKRWGAAASHLGAALVLDPSDPARLVGLAAALDGLGERTQATIALRQAVSLTYVREERARRWADVARNAESRGLTTEAIDAWMRARSLAPDPAIDARLDELYKVEPVTLMSPRSLCPSLLDAWGCVATARAADGDMKCACTIERLQQTPAAIDGGVRSVDEFGIARLDDRVLLSAALIRLRGAGWALLDVWHLAVETGSGGWQLIGRAVEGWQPGAPLTAWDGALVEMGFRPIGDVQRHGSTLVLRTVRRITDAAFAERTVVRSRDEFIFVCNAHEGLRCVRLPVAGRWSTRPFPGTDGPSTDTDWAVDARLDRDGTLIVAPGRGQLPEALEPLIGSHPMQRFGELPEAVVVPLR